MLRHSSQHFCCDATQRLPGAAGEHQGNHNVSRQDHLWKILGAKCWKQRVCVCLCRLEHTCHSLTWSMSTWWWLGRWSTWNSWVTLSTACAEAETPINWSAERPFLVNTLSNLALLFCIFTFTFDLHSISLPTGIQKREALNCHKIVHFENKFVTETLICEP